VYKHRSPGVRAALDTSCRRPFAMAPPINKFPTRSATSNPRDIHRYIFWIFRFCGPRSAGSSSTANSDTGLTGQTFGGAGIVGFSPASAKPSILIYKKKNHYNEWEFVYDPLTDMKTISGNTGNIGQPASSTTTPVGGSSSSSPDSTSPSSTPATPTTPTSPQQ